MHACSVIPHFCYQLSSSSDVLYIYEWSSTLICITQNGELLVSGPWSIHIYTVCLFNDSM